MSVEPKAALIFDLGGVLINWNPRNLYRKLFPGDEEGMERFLREIDFSAWNLELDRGTFTFPEGVLELSERFPHYARQIQAFDERWEECLDGEIRPMTNAVRKFKKQGWEMHGLTNFSAEKFALTRKRFHVLDLFESILVSGEVGLLKPNPQFYQMLLEQIRRPAEECIFIDDMPANTATAAGMGFKTVQYQNAAQCLEELAKLGVTV